ncbi:hypothetical protein BDV26DRAFT_264607 [Aspergillus bertholletiae]|uniref:Uncharacterized protein n=1 Tax=Aspergillus bertholletiae TaxID=1226010 RepID=A0A5N7B438_9EURO|nr:hypothetical protein BDV26DRAFT_264607 [Aspergillus bertholletiae]
MKVITIICLWLIPIHCYPSGMDWDSVVRYHQQVLQGDADRGFWLERAIHPNSRSCPPSSVFGNQGTICSLYVPSIAPLPCKARG